MQPVAISVTAREHSLELARWYHELAKQCIVAAEQHLALTEESSFEDVESALATNDLIRARISTVQSVERVFRSEFPREYINHQVEEILGMDSRAAGI